MISRRRILTGLLAAPLVIRTAGLLMPVKKIIVVDDPGYSPSDAWWYARVPSLYFKGHYIGDSIPFDIRDLVPDAEPTYMRALA